MFALDIGERVINALFIFNLTLFECPQIGIWHTFDTNIKLYVKSETEVLIPYMRYWVPASHTVKEYTNLKTNNRHY